MVCDLGICRKNEIGSTMKEGEMLKEQDHEEQRFAAAKYGRGLSLAKSAA